MDIQLSLRLLSVAKEVDINKRMKSLVPQMIIISRLIIYFSKQTNNTNINHYYYLKQKQH